MAADDNWHSRFVGWAKILLPLMALALLSTMFLFARTSGDASEIPFAELDEIAREQKITAPTFSGVATDGSLITITAETAQPDQGDLSRLTINAPRLTLNAADGTQLTIAAGAGQINTADNLARLSGLARLDTSSGYQMETTDLIADLGSGVINSLGPLAVRAPFGELTAGLLRIELGEENTGQQIHFTDGVKMLYEPSKDNR